MGELRIIRTRDDLREHMAQWEAAQDDEAARAKLPVGAILGLEGADSVVEPDQLEEWWDDGIRLISIGHYGMSPYGGGTGVGTDVGLLERGPGAPPRDGPARDAARRDAHLRPIRARGTGGLQGPAARDPLQRPSALPAASASCRTTCVQAVIDRDGVVGASMDTWMIWPEGRARLGHRQLAEQPQVLPARTPSR